MVEQIVARGDLIEHGADRGRHAVFRPRFPLVERQAPPRLFAACGEAVDRIDGR